jgi:uncharacterized protein YkwD
MGSSRSRIARAGMAAVVAGILVAGGPAASPAEATTTAEENLFALTNQARTRRDRPRLQLSQSLSRKAHRHSGRMADKGSIFHHSCLSCLVSSWDWDALGENVGVGGTVRSVHRALMDSRSHRRNILSRSFTKVGVGVVRSGGRVWVTEIFLG